MPDHVNIRSFLTLGGTYTPSDFVTSQGARTMNGLSDTTMTPQPNRYSTVKQLASSLTNTPGSDTEEQKGGTPAMTKDVRDILEELQNNSLQIFALWSEEGDVHRSFIQQPLRASSLNSIAM